MRNRRGIHPTLFVTRFTIPVQLYLTKCISFWTTESSGHSDNDVPSWNPTKSTTQKKKIIFSKKPLSRHYHRCIQKIFIFISRSMNNALATLNWANYTENRINTCYLKRAIYVYTNRFFEVNEIDLGSVEQSNYNLFIFYHIPNIHSWFFIVFSYKTYITFKSWENTVNNNNNNIFLIFLNNIKLLNL